jgi:hypothetical protein
MRLSLTRRIRGGKRTHVTGTATALLDFSVPLSTNSGSSSSILTFSGGDVNLDDVDVTQIKSTAQGIAVLFPVGEIKTTEDAREMIKAGANRIGASASIEIVTKKK